MPWKTWRAFANKKRETHECICYDGRNAWLQACLLGVCLQVLRSRQEGCQLPEMRRPADRAATPEPRPPAKEVSPLRPISITFGTLPAPPARKIWTSGDDAELSERKPQLR